MEQQEENIALNQSENLVSSCTDTQQTNICTIVPSGGEILLYVGDNASQGVQDLIRVALNQNLDTANSMQNQLASQESNKISLQNIEAPTIISMPTAEISSSNNVSILGNGQLLSQQPNTAQITADGGVVINQGGKPLEMSGLFQLANATGNIQEILKGEGINEGIHQTSVESPNKIDVDDNNDDNLPPPPIGEFIIADTEPTDTEHIIPGELNLGDTFYCLEDVEVSLRLYEEKHGVKLYKRDVRSLEALLKRSLKLQKLDKINEHLKYGQLLYCCVMGGKRKAQKVACMDESGLSRYTDCKMHIRFAISDDGMKLVVNSKHEVHNHDIIVSNEQEADTRYVVNPGNAEEIKLGAGFVDLEELYKAIQKYETENHVHLWRRDGRTIEALAKRAPGTARKVMETNPGLRFAELRYCCSYGGRQGVDQKKERRSSSSFKQGCEMHIRFGISEDGSQLVVKSMSEEHNHEINEETIVKEALHPDLSVYISKLVWNDLNIPIDEVKQRLDDYVNGVMFKGQTAPPRTRRQYYPSKKQIRYFISKAKSSLNISPESEVKLNAQAIRLQNERADEKFLFNFNVKHSINVDGLSMCDESCDGNGEDSALNQHEQQGDQQQENICKTTNNSENAKVLFCHQTPYQQRLLKRYNSQLIITQVDDLHSKIPFPLFCLYVQTNVDFQLVGEFIVQANNTEMINEALQRIKEWNPGWNPKFVVVDFCEEQINAVENVFSGSFVLISDSSREKAWNDWLSRESNGVSQFQDDVIKYLEAIANSYSEETLNTAARELEESDVWKMSDKLRDWFQLNWLAQAKRWVAGYRPDDYLMTAHTGRVLDDELKIFKSVKLNNKSSPLQELIQQLVEHVVPVFKKQYEILNRDSCRLQRELFYLYSDIPNYLSNLPGKMTHHIHERFEMANAHSFTITTIQPGAYSVQGQSTDDDSVHTVSFGDNGSFPSCDCADWQRFKLPCIHFCSIFQTFPDWMWDMMSVPYRSHPIFNIDWSISPDNTKQENPGFFVDRFTQTTDANLISTPSDLRITKIGDLQKILETPQVLASHCRTLLLQLSKLQLAQHSRENLHRLKSELKELISRFSTPQNVLTMTTSLPRLMLGKGGKKVGETNAQSVFDQYNVKLVTPRQIIESVSATPITTNENTPDSDISSTVEAEKVSTTPNTPLTTIQAATKLTIKGGTPNVRKRIAGGKSVLIKPPDKRAKTDPTTAAQDSLKNIMSTEEKHEELVVDDNITFTSETEQSAFEERSENIPVMITQIAPQSTVENLEEETDIDTSDTAINEMDRPKEKSPITSTLEEKSDGDGVPVK